MRYTQLPHPSATLQRSTAKRLPDPRNLLLGNADRHGGQLWRPRWKPFIKIGRIHGHHGVRSRRYQAPRHPRPKSVPTSAPRFELGGSHNVYLKVFCPWCTEAHNIGPHAQGQVLQAWRKRAWTARSRSSRGSNGRMMAAPTSVQVDNTAYPRAGPRESRGTGAGAHSAEERDKTLSRSCLVSKRKNFVSRARATSLRSMALSAQKNKRT